MQVGALLWGARDDESSMCMAHRRHTWRRVVAATVAQGDGVYEASGRMWIYWKQQYCKTTEEDARESKEWKFCCHQRVLFVLLLLRRNLLATYISSVKPNDDTCESLQRLEKAG